MTAKDEFLGQFEKETKMKAESFKDNPKGFATALNAGSGELRAAFREAVKPAETDASAGLANLFG